MSLGEETGAGGFICALNRDRDDYQLPRALHEAGLLSAMVTDFYAPDRTAGWLPAALRKRRAPGLPSSTVKSDWPCFALQTSAELLHLPMNRVFPITDAMLARTAGRMARRRHAHLYCYSPYLPPDDAIPGASRRAIFEFHPLPGLLWELLDADHARYPQVAWSNALERQELERGTAHDVWQRADAVACASTLTKRSLVQAGCDPARVTVIPYGFEPPAFSGSASLATPQDGRCEFLFVGQGVQRKGLHHLIEAWQRADLPDARLTLICYRVDPGIRDMIRSPSILLLGQQSDAALDGHYRRAHVFAMPSLIEGFGLVYLEALARGCHVIGTGNTGLPDLALPAEAATIVEVGDIDAIAASLAEARVRHLAGRLDRDAIRAAATCWGWQDFRAGIAAHARSVLPGNG